jgi:Phospholipid methyltransferase
MKSAAVGAAPPSLAVGQVQHISGLSILLVLLWNAWKQLLDSRYTVEFWSPVAAAMMHQFWVLVWCRFALRQQEQQQQQRGGSSLFGGGGTESVAFRVYAAGFVVLICSRIILTARLAYKDRDSLQLKPLPRVVITLLLLMPSLYTVYSVHAYFGFVRAMGADHFDVKKYRSMPLVNQGIFQYTSNAMYKFGLLFLHIIAIALNSKAALCMSLFQHIYIWLHFFTTEKPDMEYIYGCSSQKKQ